MLIFNFPPANPSTIHNSLRPKWFYTMFIHQSIITCFITAALLMQLRCMDSSSDLPALTRSEAIVGLCVDNRPLALGRNQGLRARGHVRNVVT